MRSLRLLCLLITVTLGTVVPVNAANYYVVPNSTTAGDITFIETYPKVAARQAHNTSFHNNPYTDVWCYDANGNQIYSGETVVDTKSSTADGFMAVTYPLTLPSGNCQVSLGYWTLDKTGAFYTQVAFSQFTVQ